MKFADTRVDVASVAQANAGPPQVFLSTTRRAGGSRSSASGHAVRPRRRSGFAAAGLSAALSVALFAVLCGGAGAAPPGVLVNPFHDPFEQATRGLAACPVPSPPTYTHAEMQEAEHHRVERGNSCYLAGKCRLSNSFDYDRGIARALLPALRADPQLRDTSVWLLVQGRFVQLFGCVTRREQIAHLEAVTRATPEVQAVVSDMLVGTQGKPPYAQAGAGQR